MNLLRKTIFLFLLVGLVPPCGSFADDTDIVKFKSHMKSRLRELYIHQSASNLVLLRELQDGNVNVAVELLEFSIDNEIVFLEKAYRETTGSEQQRYRDALLSIKENRSEHPRNKRSFPELSEYNDDISLARTRALEILSNFD